MAQEAYCIGPPPAIDSYLQGGKIIDVAKKCGADGIHPGYGFLAENAEFANVCSKCGITFIGPAASDIELMGDKLRAREASQKAGLPLLPSVQVDTMDPEKVAKAVERMGFPVMVKARAGGGGKGIKIVRSVDQLENTIRTAQAEAQAAFGNSSIYLERFLEKAKHIEFQIASDGHGNVVHLGERDCSVQRRYQEESL